MVKSEDMPAVTAFTEEFARILRAVVDEAGVSRQAIAADAGRSRSFVSDQLLGKRPVDTDVISAIAAQFGVTGRFLVGQVLAQLPPDVVGIPGLTPKADRTGAQVTPLPRRKASAPADTSVDAAALDDGSIAGEQESTDDGGVCDRMDLLFRHASDLGLTVEWAPLGDTRRGEYHHDRRLIILNRALTRAQAVACLAHEVGHAIHGDRGHHPAAERRADEMGASLIITPEAYRQAEAVAGAHPGAIALVLGVTPRLVLAWQRWWSRHPERSHEVA